MADRSGKLHLAQINIGRLRAPTDDPMIAEFMAALDEINALAERSPGFVWRFMTEDGNATAVRPFEDELMLINMSAWESIESLGIMSIDRITPDSCVADESGSIG